eukprot:TRINITY_DN6440_c1_g1_i1.p1 TRINITY_DN6440_c1_g1~~TRINITY_DN6440_c1_g1_i1.p1  ORF type:complete len:823 (+),score=144.59 TRINITY_DN6440_c1_g1_i1:161-2629(+)
MSVPLASEADVGKALAFASSQDYTFKVQSHKGFGAVDVLRAGSDELKVSAAIRRKAIQQVRTECAVFKKQFLKIDVALRSVIILNRLKGGKHSTGDVKVAMPVARFRIHAVKSSKILQVEILPEYGDGKDIGSKKRTFHFKSKEARQRFLEVYHLLQLDPTATSYSLLGDCRVLCATWNMGDTEPQGDLSRWLCPSPPSNPPNGAPPDLKKIGHAHVEVEDYSVPFEIIAVAVQECSHEPTVEGAASTVQDWLRRVNECISTTSTYDLVGQSSLLTMHLFVFVASKSFNRVTRVSIGTEATGLARVIGNKGAMAIRFNFDETALCFLGSHLAAHQDKVADRNRDFKEIVKEINIGSKKLDFTAQFNHMFWMGDLNYRIDLPRKKVCELTAKSDWKTLNEHDQLNKERKAGRVFQGWEEGKVSFRPTYRYLRGTNDYNDELGRIPAWCDRVLWKSLSPSDARSIHLHQYESIAGALLSSDHHPVRAVFGLKTVKRMLPRRSESIVIEFTNMAAHGIKGPVVEDKKVGTDPYLHFSGKFLDPSTTHKTSCKTNTRDPVWKDSEVPVLIPCVTCPTFLQRRHIFVTILARNLKKVDTFCGSGAISLDGCSHLTEQCSRPDADGVLVKKCEGEPFSIDIWKNGERCGTLTGRVQIRRGNWAEARKQFANVFRYKTLKKHLSEEGVARSGVRLAPPYLLRVVIAEAHNLEAMDIGGKSDPYATVKYGPFQSKTPVIRCSLNPVWTDKNGWDWPGIRSSGHTLTVQLFDKDRLSSDDFLGEVKVDLTTIPIGESRDLWYPLRAKKEGKEAQGEVRMIICRQPWVKQLR